MVINMELNQKIFMEELEQLRETARLQGNMLTSVQINQEFSKWQLNEMQLAMIQDYFRKNHIGIDEPLDAADSLSGEDANFLEMYFDELKELPDATDGEKRAVMMSSLAGDGNAQARLVELYLPQVVEISKLYAGQGALVEDLIGEGNVALAMAVTMLDCVDGIDEIEGFLVKMVMDAMEEFIGDASENRELGENVLNKVNEVNDKAKELYDNLLRKVYVKEVADELGLTGEEVREVIELSANCIDYIEDIENVNDEI